MAHVVCCAACRHIESRAHGIEQHHRRAEEGQRAPPQPSQPAAGYEHIGSKHITSRHISCKHISYKHISYKLYEGQRAPPQPSQPAAGPRLRCVAITLPAIPV